MHITVRPARDEDHEALVSLHDEARDDLRGAGLPAEVLATVLEQQRAARDAVWAARFAGLRAVVAVAENGRVVGAAVLGEEDGALWVVDLVVARTARRRGVGSVLLDAAVVAAGVRPLRLSVRHGNDAVRLYLRRGFVERGRTPTHVELELLPGA